MVAIEDRNLGVDVSFPLNAIVLALTAPGWIVLFVSFLFYFRVIAAENDPRNGESMVAPAKPE